MDLFSSSDEKKNILVVYYYTSYPMQANVEQHLYSFKRYSKHRFFYHNVAIRKIPRILRTIKFDLVIFHNTFFGARWNLPHFKKLIKEVSWLKELSAVKVMTPQEEFLYPTSLSEFVNSLAIDCIFSVSPPSEWDMIYSGLDREKVKILQVLTGYLDEKVVKKIDRLAQSNKARRITIGYRTRPWKAGAWLGRHNYLKAKIADVVDTEAKSKDLVTDISTQYKDLIMGDHWYRFLLNCKYTIGIEGGASLFDKTGTIKQGVETYLRSHPEATFDEVEKAVFPHLDGNFKLFALSPRQLEACATRTCQILVEGNYNGILLPGKHYLSLKKDFSNLDEILNIVKEDKEREAIVQNAYADIVLVGEYTYRKFVAFILENSLQKEEKISSFVSWAYETLLYRLNAFLDILDWGVIVFYCLFIRSIRMSLRKLR